MNFIALFFLCVRMFHFIHSRRIAYLLQRFSRILDERRANPGRKQVIIIDGSATTFIIYFLLDVFFLLYCIWLMLHDNTWTPGFLLLVIAALESLAIHARISGAYDEDEEGFVYFRGRRKRMIISSGYNVYPGQLENILDAHEKVQMSCIIGVPDAYKMQKVKAFVMLKPGVPADDNTKQELLAYCRKHIAKYAMPYDIEFRDELPKTLVGKVAYRVLEDEEKAKLAARQTEA